MSGDRPGWDQAVEAAARALFNAILARGHVDNPVLWHGLSSGEQDAYMEDAVIHLAAAFPVIEAAVRQHIAADLEAEANREASGMLGDDSITVGHRIYYEGVVDGERRAARIARGES